MSTAVTKCVALDAWLGSHGAHCLWQLKQGRNLIEAWVFPATAKIAHVVRYDRGDHGWDIYTAADTNLAGESLSDAAARLGVSK